MTLTSRILRGKSYATTLITPDSLLKATVWLPLTTVGVPLRLPIIPRKSEQTALTAPLFRWPTHPTLSER